MCSHMFCEFREEHRVLFFLPSVRRVNIYSFLALDQHACIDESLGWLAGVFVGAVHLHKCGAHGVLCSHSPEVHGRVCPHL